MTTIIPETSVAQVGVVQANVANVVAAGAAASVRQAR